MTMRCNKIIGILLILIFLIVFFSCSYFLLKDFFELKESDEDTEELIEDAIEIIADTEYEDEKIYIDWNYLKSTNQDIIRSIIVNIQQSVTFLIYTILIKSFFIFRI